jgi:hypothetical protein
MQEKEKINIELLKSRFLERLEDTDYYTMRIIYTTYDGNCQEEWSLEIEKDEVKCNVIHHLNCHGDDKYFITFTKKNIEIRRGVVTSDETVELLLDWFLRHEETFKSYTTPLDELLEIEPSFANIKAYLRFVEGKSYLKKFESKARYLEADWYDTPTILPFWKCFWDRQEMFEVIFREKDVFIKFMKLWLVDYERVTAIQTYFPLVHFGKKAIFWDMGEKEKAHKVHSWNKTQDFYTRLAPNNYFQNHLPLVLALREKGYDEIFYANYHGHAAYLILQTEYGLNQRTWKGNSIVFHTAEHGHADTKIYLGDMEYESQEIGVLKNQDLTEELESLILKYLNIEKL